MKSLAALFTILGLPTLPLMADPGASSLIPGISANETAGVQYAEWADGAETPVVRKDGRGNEIPTQVLWSPAMINGFRPLLYGDSKNPGVRYLRIFLNQPVTVGSILVHGNGQVSVLKPGATAPGSLTDESLWIPAQRLKDGKVTTDEPGVEDEVLWTLPEPVSTQAIRITHTAQPIDKVDGGALGGLALFPDRWANLAPQAIASASAADQFSPRLNDGSVKLTWENISLRDGDRPETVTEKPEWMKLVWPKPVTLAGLALIGTELGAIDIQAYNGPAGIHPNEAPETNWQTIQTIAGIKPQYPYLSNIAPIAFKTPVTTRALRIRVTAATADILRSKEGKRVALAEWMALQPLGNATLASAILPPPATAAVHGPVPIKFTLPEDGEVTLVIEDSTGKRVRNLVSQAPFPKGENTVWWDCTDDLGRDMVMAAHGIYFLPPNFVPPGSYTVRGIWHKPLDIHYEFSIYSPGDPPWDTADTSGGWMTNHTPASSAVFIPATKAPGGQPLIGIGAYVSEGGSCFSWITPDGKKIGGRGWIGGAWTGAQYLAGDFGPNADSTAAAYVGAVALGNKKYGVNGKVEVRLTRMTNLLSGGDKPVLKEEILLDPPPFLPPAFPGGNPIAPDVTNYLGGIAVYNGGMVISETALNKLVFIDAKEGTITGEATVPDPRGLAFDDQGRLLVLSSHDLLRYPAGASPTNLPQPEKLATGLDDPQGITIDANGKIYVADQGNSHQVKTFSSNGQPSIVYGKPGAPKAGLYDPLHMNSPKGLAVDPNGRLWVAENDFYPKRVSVWNTDGTLWKAWYGPARYGGGGILDSGSKGTFLYDGMEFSLDWDKGTYTPSRIDYRSGDNSNLKLAFRAGPPESVVYFNGKRYLTDAYNSHPTNGQNSVFLFLDKGDGGATAPVAGAGSAYDWPILKTDAFKSLWPQGLDPLGDRAKNQAFFLWSDLNGDGQVQPDEVKIIAGISGGVTVADDGSFLISRLGADKDHLNATRFKPVRFTDLGVPVYDIAAGETLAPAQMPGSDGHDQLLSGTGGWLVMTTPPPPFSRFGLGGAKDGKPAWSYPSLWPGLHPSHDAPTADEPGNLIGTTRLLGGLVTPKGSEAGPLFFINSNMGSLYAFTQDGLFVAQLFHDVRQAPLWQMPKAIRNMRVNDLSLHDENFFPSVAQTSDGTVYVNSGGMNLDRVDNLGTIRNIPPMPIQVTADDLKLAQAFVVAREAARQAAQGTGILEVPILATAPTLDRNFAAWKDAQWVPIDHRGVGAWFNGNSKPFDVNGTVAIAGGNLYAAWKTGDPLLIQNAGDVPNGLFKSGGALDLMIGADPMAKSNRPGPVPGDIRLLVSKVGGKTKALLYRAVVPGTADKDKVPFNAPWHGITLDRVDDVSSQVQLTADKNGNYQIAVPLTVLGLKPEPGTRIKADIGVLRGDGHETTQRVYWANKATAIVSDVPTEAELTPALWGTWEFSQK